MKMCLKFFAMAICVSAFAFGATAIVRDGKAAATIVMGEMDNSIPLDSILARTPLQNAERLSALIEKSTGAKLAIVDKDGSVTGGKIVLSIAKPGLLDMEGFVIEFPSEDVVNITGGGPRGLEYGVTEFLERYVGVRWLFPSDLGLYVPEHKEIIIKDTKRVAQSPAFFRRFMAGGSHRKDVQAQYCQWIVDCKGNFHQRFNVPHNMWRIISVKKYAATHPEFFPIYGGKRYIPEEDNQIRWNHCYTAKGLVDAVVEECKGKKMVSLCVNDGGHFCECEECLKLDGNTKNYIGLPNRSKSYLLFCNAVAKRCPDTLFGFDAYNDMAEPPVGGGIVLEKNLIPVLTYDTYQWMDSARRERSQNLLKRWQEISPGGSGWYDYIYGHGYVFPRIYTHFLANNIRYLHTNGVRYFQGEYYPDGSWLDCVKGYVVYKLLWDITLDTDEIVDDWCRSCVGDDAAPILKEFYRRVEAFWEAPEVRRTPWFKEHTYLSWVNATLLDALPETTIEELSKLMDEMLAKAPGNPRAARLHSEYMKMKPKLLLYKTNQRLREEAKKFDFNELVMKSDFDKGSPGWSTWKQSKENGKLFHSPDEGRNGSGAVGIDLEGARRLSLCYLGYAKIKPGALYKVTAWHNAIGMTPTSYVNISVRYQKDNKWMDSSLNSEKTYTITEKDAGWTQTDIYVKAPDDEGAKMVIVLGAGKAEIGKVLFDDVSVSTCK